MEYRVNWNVRQEANSPEEAAAMAVRTFGELSEHAMMVTPISAPMIDPEHGLEATFDEGEPTYLIVEPEPGTKRLTLLVVERFGDVQASVHEGPEAARKALHGLVIEWNEGQQALPEDAEAAIHEYFASLGHYADYALVPVELGTG